MQLYGQEQFIIYQYQVKIKRIGYQWQYIQKFQELRTYKFMMSIEQVKFKQILISQRVIDGQGIVSLCELISSHNLSSKTKLIATCFNDQKYQIRLLLLTHTNHTNLNKEQLREKWLICHNDEQIIPPANIRGILLLSSYDLNNKRHYFHQDLNLFEIRSLTQAFNILSLTSIQMQNRIKMERMLKKSHIKYQQSILISNFKIICSKLVEINDRKDIKMLCSVIRFEGQRKLKLMRKYFVKWLMIHYETVINKRENQIVKCNYLMLKSNKELKEKVFLCWKSLRIQGHIRNKNQ